MSYIPIVKEPYPDEMLYSWIHRLSKANGLSISVFGRQYLNQQGIFSGELPYDIRHEFVYLCRNMLEAADPAGLYLEHSSFRFDSLFRTKKTNCRIANNIALHTDEINPTLKREIKIYACQDCIKEDMEMYGEPYLHIRHHIGDTRYCRKHKTPLMMYTGKRSHECEFRPEMYTTVELVNDMEYGYFVDDLYNLGINGNVECLKRAVIKKIMDCGYGLHGEGYERLERDFNSSEYSRLLDKSLRYCIENYFIKKKAYPCRVMVPLLMFLFKDAEKLKEYVDDDGPILKNAICTRCKKVFLSMYDIRYSMGLCPCCYMEIPLEERFENIINVANDGEYRVVSPFSSMNTRVDVMHSCGRITSMIPRNLIYGESRCPCKKTYDDVWNEHFKLLQEYINANNTVDVPKKTIYKGFKLGQWVHKTRSDKTRGVLPIERELALLEIGFDFSPIESAWNRNFELYKEYVEKYKNAHISDGKVYNDINLGTWYALNRRKCINGKLSAEKIEKFKSLNQDFPKLPERPVKKTKLQKKVVRFEEAVELLLQYKDKFGGTDVPVRFVFQGYKLGQWVNDMRQKKRHGHLSEDKIHKLDDIGFEWSPIDTQWDRNNAIYKEYSEAHNTGHISRSLVYKGVNLGEWYANNRKKFLKGDMPKEQVDKIRSVNPDFPNLPSKPVKEEKPKKKIVRFEEAVSLLQQYEEEYGNMNIPKRKEYGGYKLGIWANQMRSKHKQGILPEDQVNILNEIGFDWEPLKTKWETDIARYRRYVYTTGKAEVPKEEVFENYSMGYWYSNLKISRKNHSLSDEQISDILKINPAFI